MSFQVTGSQLEGARRLNWCSLLPDGKPEPNGSVNVKGQKAELESNPGLGLSPLGPFPLRINKNHVT